MIKCLSGFRIDCSNLHVFYQAAVCCRTITMSGSPEKTPPIGAFVINPLPNSTEKQTNVCAYKAKEDAGPMRDTHSAIERKGIGEVNDWVNEGERLLKHNKYDRSDEGITGLNGDRNTLRNNNDNLQDNNVPPSVCSSLHIKADSLNTGMSRVSGTRVSGTHTGIPSKESAGKSGNNSSLMMKLAVSGPPKCKFDEKKTVLPPSLLQGVTELVQKGQVHQDNGSVSGTGNKDKSACAERSSSFRDRQQVFDLEKEGISKKNILKIEKRNKQSVKENKADDAGSYNLHGNAKVMLPIDESEGIYKCPVEKHDTINVPCSDAISSGIIPLEMSVVESAAEIEVSESVNLHQGGIDMSVSSKFGAETDQSEITALTKTSELAHAYPEETIESNIIDHQVEVSDSASSKHSNEINQSTGSTHHVGTDDSIEKSRNKVQNSVSDVSVSCEICETETVMSEHIDKTLSPHSPDETDVECEVNPFSEMDFDDLLDGDIKISDVSVGSQGNKETDVGNSDAKVNELLHIDISVLGKKSAKQVDTVYNLSDLFSGELEQRRKKELRKQKRKAKKWERLSKKDRKHVSGDTTDKAETEEKEEKRRKPVPNYFVAIQITDQKIKAGLKAVQDKVVSENKKLQPALNKLATLHLTMMVLSLKTEDDMESQQIQLGDMATFWLEMMEEYLDIISDRSRRALDKASEKLLSQYTDVSLELDISGLGHFRNRVVFAKVKHEHQISTLKSVADTVEECFMEQEVVSPDQRGFKPHITIMKLSSVKGLKKKGLKKIDEKLYSDYLDTDFGSETISTLQLCAMMKPKDKQGYYQVEHQVQFAKMQDSGMSKHGPNTMGDTSDHHVEVEKESELNYGVKSSHMKDTEVHTVENTKDVKEVNSKQDIKVRPAGDVNEEALNKTSKLVNLMEKNIVENNIKKETENMKSVSRDNLDQVDDDKSKGILEKSFKKNDKTNCTSITKEEDVNTVMETVTEKADSVQIEFAAVKESSYKIKDPITNVTETQSYPKKLNSGITGKPRTKDIKPEVGEIFGQQVNQVTEIFKIVDHPEIKEAGKTEVEKISEESCENVVEISRDNDSALDVSVESVTPAPKGSLNELSVNDSAIDLSVNIENIEVSEMDNSLDNDSCR